MMKQGSVLTRILTYSITTMLVFSCKRDERTIWQTDVALPLAQGKITIDQLVADSLLQSDETGLWHLIVDRNLTDFNLDSLVEIPDTTIRKNFDIPLLGGPFLLPPNTTIISQSENNTLNLNQVQLKQIKLKSGSLQYAIKSYVNGFLYCKYNLPGVTLNNTAAIIETTTQPASDASPFIYSGSIDLAGYTIDLTGINGNQFNKIVSQILLKVAPDAPSSAQVFGDDSVVVELRFVEPKVAYAKGYFGEHLYELNEQIDLGESINLPTGSLQIEHAEMKLNIINSVGADAQLKINELSSFNTGNSQLVDLNFAPIQNYINITRALDVVGQVSSTEYLYEINPTNSNILPFIENLPDKLNVDAIVKINPLGDISSGNDFIYTDNALKALIQLEVPLSVGMNNLMLRDTLILSNDALDLKANGKLILDINNSFPLNAVIKVDLINNENQFSSNLLLSGVVYPAILTAQPGTTIPVSSQIQIPISQSLIDQIKSSNRIVVTASLNTPGYPETVGIYRDYFLAFRLSAIAEVEVGYE